VEPQDRAECRHGERKDAAGRRRVVMQSKQGDADQAEKQYEHAPEGEGRCR